MVNKWQNLKGYRVMVIQKHIYTIFIVLMKRSSQQKQKDFKHLARAWNTWTHIQGQFPFISQYWKRVLIQLTQMLPITLIWIVWYNMT